MTAIPRPGGEAGNILLAIGLTHLKPLPEEIEKAINDLHAGVKRRKNDRERGDTYRVDAAVVAYLRDGRPKSSCRRLFLRTLAPNVGFAFGCAITMIANTALQRAGSRG